MLSSISSSNYPHRGATSFWPLLVIALGCFAAWYWYDSGNSTDEVANHDAILHKVAREDFQLVINERGTVESSGSVEIRSEVQSNASGISILKIIPEGTPVKEGDFLAQLDASLLESERTLQMVKVNTAEAAAIEAKNSYETALIDYEQYKEGQFVQEKQTIQSEIFVKEEDLSRAEEYLAYSKKLAERGYVNELQLQADTFAVEKSKKELEAANTKLRVLEDYTRQKELKTRDSTIATSKAKWESMKENYRVELDRLATIEDQIKKCEIFSPGEGVVKYAHMDSRRGNDGFIIEEGALVRERQVIIRLPDPSKMEVQVSINEALIENVREGMSATITPVGSGDTVLNGVVERVNEYAQPENWRRMNVKEYKVAIRILDISPKIKTGMTVAVTIDAMYVPDALQAPVEAVYAHGDDRYCFLEIDGQLEPKKVSCGQTNDRYIVINKGLEVDDLVALNPRRFLDQVNLPELPTNQLQQQVDSGKASRTLRKQNQAGKPTANTSAQAPTTANSEQGA